MATIDLGKIKLVNKNTWDSNTTYTADDIVQYTDNGILSTYICVVSSSQGHTPSSSGTTHASWNFLAKGIADPIPSQSGNAGKALITNGSAVSWGDGGAWTKIASGSGPSSAVTSLSIDNIFSDTYQFYKIYYSFAQDDWMKGRYIKADGSIESGSVYVWTGQYSRENADDDGDYGSTNANHATYHYWDSADDCPALCEISFYDPYSSSKETVDFVNAAMVQGSRVIWQSGMNCNMNAYSVRGINFFTANGDTISDGNFKYLVLGSKI